MCKISVPENAYCFYLTDNIYENYRNLLLLQLYSTSYKKNRELTSIKISGYVEIKVNSFC